MASLGEASVRIVPDTSGFGEQVSKDVNQALGKIDKAVDETADNIDKEFTDAGKQAEKAVDGISGEFKKLGKLIAGAAIGKAVMDFAKSSIAAASDLGESINAVQVTYGDLSDTILDFSKVSAQAVGLASSDFNSFAVQFAGFTKQIATGSKTAADVTVDLTKRIADFASVMNLDLNDAATVFASTLAGESEAIRRYGIDMSAAAIETYALANGLIASKGEMTAAIKVQATYAKLMEDTNQVANDFTNTSDSLANRQRILAAEFKNMQTEVGAALIPTLESLLGVVGPLVSGFAGLPDPMQQAITFAIVGGGAFIALSSALQGVGVAVGTANIAVAGFLAVAAGAVILLKAFQDRGKEAREAQQNVTEALIAANEPAYVLSERIKSLVSDYKALNPAAEEADDGVTIFAGALDATRAAILTFTPAFTKAGVSLEDVAAAAAEGSDSFDKIADGLGFVSNASATTADSFDSVSKAIINGTEAGDPMRKLLLDLAKNGGLTINEFRTMVKELDLTSDGFDDSREALNKQNEEFLRSTDAVTAFSDILGGDVYANLVKNADATADVAGRTDEFTFLIETLNQMLFEQGWELDATTGKFKQLEGATDSATGSTDNFAQSSQDAADALIAQQNAMQDLLDATLASFNSDIAYEQAKRDTKDAIDALTQSQKDLENGTLKGEEAARAMTEATEDLYLTALRQGDAAVKAAEDTAKKSGADLTAQQAAKIHREELAKVAESLEPNSPLRRQLRDYMLELSRIERNISVTVRTIFVEERRVINADRAMADGGVVTRPTVALIGEAGDEVVIPLTRPGRALELMQQTGLVGMIGQDGAPQTNTINSPMSLVGSSKATVNIESANFYNGTDANLVAQKVNAAERTRSFGS